MGKGTGGAGRFVGTERQAARALRFPTGPLTGRGQRVFRRMSDLQTQILRTGDALTAARVTSFGGTRYTASYRKQQAAKAAKLEKRMATLQRRREVLQRSFFAGFGG